MAGEGGIEIEVVNVPGFDTGIHAPNALSSLFKGEAEIATWSEIPTENILRFAIVKKDKFGKLYVDLKDWRDNPNFGKKSGSMETSP